MRTQWVLLVLLSMVAKTRIVCALPLKLQQDSLPGFFSNISRARVMVNR
jgi:hypothetical protein